MPFHSQRQRRLLTLSLATALGACLALPAVAHGPTRQKVTESVTIDAPATTVWAKIGSFDALKDWHPAAASSPADKGNEVGSVRTVTLQGGGGQLIETLERYDAAQMRYSYRLKDGSPLPVTNYTSTIQVTPQGDNKSVVEWRGAFYRGFPNNDPPPDQNDEAAVKAVTGAYQGGLANLKKVVEGK